MKTASYGSATINRIIDIDPFPLPLGFLLPGASVEALRPYADALAGTHVDFETGNLLLSVQSHLVRFGGKNILIDTCVGENKERPARAEWHRRQGTKYLSGLAACGCKPADVDIVMCTHLHADHVGWNTRLDSGRWVPTFPKAKYVMGRTELDYFTTQFREKPAANHASFEDSVLPIVEHGLVSTVDTGDEIAEGAKILGLPGHTPGQIGLEIAAGGGETMVFVGDAIHSPVQIYKPEWSSTFCTDRQQAENTRRHLIERSVAEDMRLMLSHLRGVASMKVREKAGAFTPAFFD